VTGKTTGDKFSPRGAFIFYRPQAKKGKELLFYNEEAWRILAMSVSDSQNGVPPAPDIYGLCRKWTQALEEGLVSPDGSVTIGSPEADYLDIIQSGRRRYLLKGIVLLDAPSLPTGPKQYLFILERLHLEKLNLPMVFRTLDLNRREGEIVQLLLGGASNKEIADALNLSINTVKGYMKLLSRKLRVNNRAGIVAAVFALK